MAINPQIKQDVLIRLLIEKKKFDKRITDAKNKLRTFSEKVNDFQKNTFRWGLGMMFFGMALKRFFQGIAQSTISFFGQIVGAQTEQGVKLIELQSKWKELKFVAGEALAPLVDELIPIVEWITNWISENKTLFRWIVKIGIILGTIFFIFGTLVLGIGSVIVAFSSATGAMAAFIAIGIVGVIIGVVRMVKRIKDMWQTVKTVWTNIKNFFIDLKNIIFNKGEKSWFEYGKAIIFKIWDGFMAIKSMFTNWLFRSAFGWGSDMIKNFFKGIKDKGSWLYNKIKAWAKENIPIIYDVRSNDMEAQKWGSDMIKHFFKGASNSVSVNVGSINTGSGVNVDSIADLVANRIMNRVRMVR